MQYDFRKYGESEKSKDTGTKCQKTPTSTEQAEKSFGSQKEQTISSENLLNATENQER